MSGHINFEDSIFILNSRIRMIHNLLLLDADPDLFLEKTLDDADFINGALAALLERLSGNTRYIEREERFQNLAETERACQGVLEEILNGAGPISAAQVPGLRERISPLYGESREREKNINALLFSAADGSTQEPLVSPDELSELLKDME
jgi:hypothetical protein